MEAAGFCGGEQDVELVGFYLYDMFLICFHDFSKASGAQYHLYIDSPLR